MDETKANNGELVQSRPALGLAPYYALWGLLFALLILLLMESVFSLAWRMQHDTPLLHYVAFLINEHGYVPYRDVFETSMPGSLLFHVLVTDWFGYGDLALRVIDLVLLAVLMSLSASYLRVFGILPALFGPLCFALFYLGFGPQMSLQRDYLGLLPIVLAIYLTLRVPLGRSALALISGVLFGLSVLFKPHLLLGLPLLVAYQTWQELGLVSLKRLHKGHFLRQMCWRTVLAMLAVAFIVSLSLLWLKSVGGLSAFLDMVWHYLPLHIQLTANHAILAPGERAAYLLAGYFEFGGYGLLCLLLLMVLVLRAYGSRKRLQPGPGLLLVSLALGYSLYPVLSGQFWDYHWIPFYYFAFMCGSLCLSGLHKVFAHKQPLGKISAPKLSVLGAMVFILVMVSVIKPPPFLWQQLQWQSPPAPNNGRVDAIAQWLRSSVQHGQKVQVMDWTGGAVHAMLEARIANATRFIYDYHFYHHVSQPYNKQLRQEFVQSLARELPPYIVLVTDKHKPRGWDTSAGFPALQAFLKRYYVIAAMDNGYVIFRRQ